MKLPVNFLLYVLTLGLCAFAGWTVYEAWLLERQDMEEDNPHTKGQREAIDGLQRGRGLSTKVESVSYNASSWRDQWMAPNLLGKDPPKPVDEVTQAEPEPVPEVDLTPLEDIIDLLVLFHDGSTKGGGGQSHVIVAYRDTVDVQPPRWYEMENQPPNALGNMSARRDVSSQQGRRTRPGRNGSSRPRQGGRGASQPGRGARGASMPMSSSTAGREVVQTLWAAGDGSKKFEATLWPPYEYIKLVRVAPDGRSAFFVRTQPPPADGEAAPEVVEEELFKSTLDISQEVLKQIAEVSGRDLGRLAPADATDAVSQWKDVQQTTEINGVFHIGSTDRDSFAKDENDFLSQINVSSYQSPLGSKRRGLRVMNISPEIRGRFGVQPGDLILSVNGRPVSTKAQAISVGKRMHQRGVRRFTVRLLSNGQEIERVYQAPDDR